MSTISAAGRLFDLLRLAAGSPPNKSIAAVFATVHGAPEADLEAAMTCLSSVLRLVREAKSEVARYPELKQEST